MELFNTVIGLLALVVAIIALLHSIYYNLVKLKLSNCITARVDKGYDWLYEFDVANLSNVSVTILKIELFDQNGKLLQDNGFDPFEKYDQEEEEIRYDNLGFPVFPTIKAPLEHHWASNPFKHDTEVFPASRETFSYYLYEKPVKIKITTDKRIHKFRKSQLFIPHFDNED